MSVETPLTRLLGIKHPIILAGMFVAGCPELAAAVSNAGGLGVIGGLHYTPEELRSTIRDLKARLRDPNLPFGVDLLLPKVGGSARKTNTDLTHGNLDELVDVIIESNTKLFVSAVGVAPKYVVDKLHANGILYMNMVGHPKHVIKACAVGADIICAQGCEAGGHIGEIPTSVLVPACAEVVKQYTSPLSGEAVQLVAAGGIYSGRSIAASFMYGASGVWVGTRFVTAVESNAEEKSKQAILDAGFESTIKTTFWTGRPLRAFSTPYLQDWEKNRQEELQDLLAKGVVPLNHELDKYGSYDGMPAHIERGSRMRPMSIASALMNKSNQTAAEIVEEMMHETIEQLNRGGAAVVVVHATGN